MTNPTPPGDIPLYNGLGVEWNDIVGALPEDRRAELAPRIKERLDAFTPLQQYSDFQKSGITSEHIGTALNIFSMIENNPREVYETIGNHLGLTPQEVKKAAETLETTTTTDTTEDPRFAKLATLEQQVETLAQIALAQRQQSNQSQQAADQDAALEQSLNDLKSKYGDIDEEEIIMRMLHKDMSAEEAFQDYASKVSELRKRRPAPMIMGSSGVIPQRQIDVAKLNSSDTRNLVAQMIQHSSNESKI